MPSVEIVSWILSGALFLLTVLGGICWTFVREEAKDHANRIEQKVDNHRFQDLESRMSREVENVKESSERLMDKLQQRHDRDLEAMQSNFREQMSQVREQLKSTELNILNQMNLLFKSNQH